MYELSSSVSLLGQTVELQWADEAIGRACNDWAGAVAASGAERTQTARTLQLRVTGDGPAGPCSFALGDTRFELTGPTGAATVDWDQGQGTVAARAGLEAVHLDLVLRHCATLFVRRRGGLLLHGAAVIIDGRAHLFCGPSGAGKSTLATLTTPLPLLSDEFAFVVPGPALLPSPAFGHLRRLDRPETSYPIGSVSLLEHGPQHGFFDLPRSVALARLTRLPSLEHDRVAELHRLEGLLVGLPIRRFSFANDETVHQFLIEQLTAPPSTCPTEHERLPQREHGAGRFVGAALELLGKELEHGRTTWLKVATASMSPRLRPGDRVLVSGTGAEGLGIGDLVVYRRDDMLVLHRLVGWRHGQLLTAGDRAAAVDPLVDPRHVLGRVVMAKRRGRALPLGGRMGARATALYHRGRLAARAALRWTVARLRSCRRKGGA